MRVDAAKVFRQGVDAVDDKRFGVACHAVFVVDGVLVVSGNQGVEGSHAQLFVRCGERHAQHVGVLLVLHDVQAAHQTLCHAVHGGYGGKHFFTIVTVVETFAFVDCNRSEFRVYFAAVAGAFPASVGAANNPEVEFVVVARAHNHGERFGYLLQRGDNHWRGVVDVHVAQIFVIVIVHVEVELAHHLVHDGG